MRRSDWLRAAAGDAIDLVLSRECLACGEPGPVLCSGCWDHLVRIEAHEVATTALGAPVVAAARYESTMRSAVNAYKERQVLAMGPALGGLLALSLRAVVPGCGHIDVVRVPAHGESIRSRGHDSLASIVRHAQRHLRDAGVRLIDHRLLARSSDAGRQVGRSAADRRRSVHESMVARIGAALPASVVVVDDVVTSGATIGEAGRALRAAGIHVRAGAAVAGTPRRRVGSADGPRADY